MGRGMLKQPQANTSWANITVVTKHCSFSKGTGPSYLNVEGESLEHHQSVGAHHLCHQACGQLTAKREN